MSTVLPPLTRPKYVGENRCWPCTTLNLAILAVVCLPLSLVAPYLSLFVAAAGLAVIRFRGYLVPFTPLVAPRLVAWLPWDPFHADDPTERDRPGHRVDDTGTGDRTGTGGPPDTAGPGSIGGRRVSDSPDDPADGAAASTGATVFEALVDAGVVDTADGDLGLDGEFRERWRSAMDALADRSPDDLAAATRDASPTAAEARAVTERDRTYVVLTDGSGEPAGESWLRRPVAIAQTGAARTLDGTSLDADRVPAAAHGLGVFLDTCPTCDAALEERPAGGCCGPPRTDAAGNSLQALQCPDCRAEFAVFD